MQYALEAKILCARHNSSGKYKQLGTEKSDTNFRVIIAGCKAENERNWSILFKRNPKHVSGVFNRKQSLLIRGLEGSYSTGKRDGEDYHYYKTRG